MNLRRRSGQAGGSSASDVLSTLRAMADPTRLEGMARYGIRTDGALGVTVTELRQVARRVGRDHDLALELWRTGVREARILASLVDDPAAVTERQMEAWVSDLDSWDVCDGVCGNLFDRTPFALGKAVEWSDRRPEFEKRAGFVLMACAAVHRKDLPDASFAALLPVIERRAVDDRTYVKKAASWALRQIGKRSANLNAGSVRTARRLEKLDDRSARWIGHDALRELESERVQARVTSGARGRG